MSWKITLPSGETYNQATITAGQYHVVADLLSDATWGHIEPTVGPRQLIAWIAVLAAQESDDKNVMNHLVEVMKMPMVELLSMIQVSD